MASGLQLYLKKLWHSCFPVNVAEFLRTALLKNISGPCLTLYRLKFYFNHLDVTGKTKSNDACQNSEKLTKKDIFWNISSQKYKFLFYYFTVSPTCDNLDAVRSIPTVFKIGLGRIFWYWVGVRGAFRILTKASNGVFDTNN